MKAKVVRLTADERAIIVWMITQVSNTTKPLSDEAVVLNRLYAKVKEEI